MQARDLRSGWPWPVLLLMLSLAACGKSDTPPPRPAAPPPVTLLVAYGSEKKTWFEGEVARFQASQPKLPSGKPVQVKAQAMGSGELVQDVLAGRLTPQVVSPASGAYLALLNHGWAAAHPRARDLAPEGEPLILSPLVIAMWRPMAEALGLPARRIGFRELIAISKAPDGWASLGHPEWGRFKLGHTHPEYSNSGLLSLLAEVYAGAGKTRDLSATDLARPEVVQFVADVEASIVHYGKSTALFSEQMLQHGMQYLSAAVLYENLVIEARAKGGPDELVAVYPVEGSFWSDHPYSVLDAPWVNDEQRAAAELLRAFLRSREAQLRALALGFRPADPALPVASPIDAAHGVDPRQPETLLDVPSGETLSALLGLFRQVKKPSSVTLVFDTSGSMNGTPLARAKAGGKAFLAELDDRDEAALAFFSGTAVTPEAPVAMATGRAALVARLEAVVADGGTALYDAVQLAHRAGRARALATPERIHALVVMTDGRDEHSELPLGTLLDELSAHGPEHPLRVFTIAYGQRAAPTVLKQIADAGGGTFVKGDVDDIVQVYRDVASFF